MAQLEALYVQFNTAHPEDFRGHSRSVSDIVALKVGGVVYKVFRMFGRIPTVPRRRLGFVETSAHEICGMPLYRIYPINPSRREQINPADKIIISFKNVSLIFLAFAIVSVILLPLFYHYI